MPDCVGGGGCCGNNARGIFPLPLFSLSSCEVWRMKKNGLTTKTAGEEEEEWGGDRRGGNQWSWEVAAADREVFPN